MNEHDLFAAIGSAEDDFLLETEQPPHRRLPGRFGLIAAILALLLTACAAPTVIRSFDKLQSGSRPESGKGYTVYQLVNGSPDPGSAHFFSSDVELTVQPDPDAPSEIREVYLPLTLLDICRIEEYSQSDSLFSLKLSMEVPKYGRIYGIIYQQHALPEDGHVLVSDFLDAVEYKASQKTYGDVTAMEFWGPDRYEDKDGNMLLYDGNSVVTFYTRHIFWSDGFYLYCLKIPSTNTLTVDKIGQILSSLAAVEDITAYLPPP